MQTPHDQNNSALVAAIRDINEARTAARAAASSPQAKELWEHAQQVFNARFDAVKHLIPALAPDEVEAARAGWLPARRAARIDPILLLRSE